jgi:hypothetical protein
MRGLETLNPEAALPFYHLPCMFIAPQGVFTAPDAETARTLLSRFMEQQRRQSYRRTDVMGLVVHKLSPILGSCSGTFVRFNTAGDEISQAGFTYTLRWTGSWRIIVAAFYEPQTP